MSEWITDRRPTVNDSDYYGYVWVTSENGTVVRQTWVNVSDRPWMPIITPPEPYVKPKRFSVWTASGCPDLFRVVDGLSTTRATVPVRDINSEKAKAQAKAVAEQIAAIYEEYMP